jgi:hypothetical protein
LTTFLYVSPVQSIPACDHELWAKVGDGMKG